jgi:hypothetical protein
MVNVHQVAAPHAHQGDLVRDLRPPSTLDVAAVGTEELDRFDNIAKFFDTWFKLAGEFGHTFNVPALVALGHVQKGINGGRKLVEGGKIIGDVAKGLQAARSQDEHGRSKLHNADGTHKLGNDGQPLQHDPWRWVDAGRYFTWLNTHIASTLNFLQQIGVVGFGAAGGVIGQLAPGFALVGFMANVAVGMVELRKLQAQIAAYEAELADGVTDQRREEIHKGLNDTEAKMNEKIVDIVKELMVWMGLFCATFLSWKCAKKYHVGKHTAFALQALSATIGIVRVFQKMRQKMPNPAESARKNEQRLARSSTMALLSPRPAGADRIAPAN